MLKISAIEQPQTPSMSIQGNQGRAPSNQQPMSESPKPSTAQVVQPKVEARSIDPKYADFAKKEAMLRSKIQAQEAAFKAREEAIKAKEAEYQSQYIQKSKIPELFQRDSAQALRELGLSGDTLTQALLNQPSPEAQMIQDLKAEIAQLKAGLDETKGQFTSRDQQARVSALNQIKADTKQLVSSDPRFETIKSTGSEQAVVEVIESKFDKDGVLISVEEAAEAVEAELIEELSKYAQLKKIQEKLQPAATVQAPQQNTKPQQSRTLAHSQVGSTQKTLSPRERAILAIQGKL